MSIGGNIRIIRENRGLTQSELADRLGISSKTVSSWEVNRTEPKMGMVEKVCAVLGCKKTDIIVESIYLTDEDMKKSQRLAAYAEKFVKLSPENRKTVEIMIDALLEQEKKEKRKDLDA